MSTNPPYRDPKCGFGAGAHAPDVAGSLFALRGWNLDDEGWLRGCTYKTAWGPGWNEAVCLVARRPSDHVSKGPRWPGFHHPFWTRMRDGNQGCLFPIEPGQPVEFEDGWLHQPCNGLARTCACGFYAYYDLAQGRTSGFGNIRGLIEATGKMVVGPLGFRAQRARVVAVVRPQQDTFKPALPHVRAVNIKALRESERLLTITRNDLVQRPWLSANNVFALLWGTAAGTLALLGAGASDRTALLGSASAVLALVGGLTWAARHKTLSLMAALDLAILGTQSQIADLSASESDVDLLMQRLQAKYPGVVIHDSMADLLEAHPVSDVRGLLGLEFTAEEDAE